MVRPAAFGFNEETAGTNRFQAAPAASAQDVARQALSEFDAAASAIRGAGVEVIVVGDLPQPRTPDAVFPNNWISTHHDGTLVLYPMFAPLRRLERRLEVIERLREEFDVRRIVDFGPNEEKGRFLEGTGSIVFDHRNRTAYAVLSPRTHRGMLLEAGELFGHEVVVFHATGASGEDVYHTNVVMSVGERFAIVCAEAVDDPGERGRVLARLNSTGREVLEVTRPQMSSFAANVLELRSSAGEPVLAASERAWNALTGEQQDGLGSLARVVTASIPTIESVGGGSLRCMIAEIFLLPSDRRAPAAIA
jgi:hypothetical protein